MQEIILNLVKKKGVKVLNGMYITYYDSGFKKEMNGWIGGNQYLKTHSVGSIDHLSIQCDDSYKGHRGVSIEVKDIISFHMIAPIGLPLKVGSVTC